LGGIGGHDGDDRLHMAGDDLRVTDQAIGQDDRGQKWGDRQEGIISDAGGQEAQMIG